MDVKKIAAPALFLSLVACKKEYTCECKNTGGVYAIYQVKDSKKGAEEKCNKYNEEANSIPWSESYCALR